MPHQEEATLEAPSQDSSQKEPPAEHISLENASQEWERLTRHFTSVVQNQAGVHQARAGHLTQALGLWQEASVSGSAAANFNMAVCYENGDGTEKNMQKVSE